MEAARSSSSRPVRFGPFTLDLHLSELRKHGTRIRLHGQPFQVLAMLLERAGDLVTREELRQRLWPDNTFVDFEHGLNAALNRLRERLGDNAEKPRYIETVPRRGYRFIGELQTEPVPVALTTSAVPPMSRLRSLWPALALSSAMMVAILGLGTSRLLHRPARPSIRSLAVLPLANLSGDSEQDYFAMGMTDELITELAHIGSLRVVSRTSAAQFKDSKKSLPEIARALNVDAIVEGSVVRTSDKVKVNVQLVDGPTDRHLWAESFQRSPADIVKLQRDLASTIAEQVKLQLTREEEVRLRSPRAVDPAAHDAYLRGRYYWFQAAKDGDPEDFRKSREYFEQALQHDPSYALAYSGLADYYGLMVNYDQLSPAEAWPKAEAYARRALELDPALAEAHNSLAAEKMYYERDWFGAEKEFRTGIAVNPAYSEIHAQYARFLAAMKRFDESVAEIKRAEALDPIAQEDNVFIILLFAHRFDEVAERCRRMLLAEPAKAHWWLSALYYAEGKREQGFQEDQQRLRFTHQNERADAREKAYAQGGLHAVFQWELKRVKNEAALGRLSPARVAAFYAGLGDRDQAMHYLEESFRKQDGEIIFFDLDPEFASLHSDPRFQDLIRRIGLPN